MTRRDPRSLMEIRRLAFRAKRSEDAREVLHDALLETFPAEYNDAIRRAQNQAKCEAQRMARLHRNSKYHPPQIVERYVIFIPWWLQHLNQYPNIGARGFFAIQDGWRPMPHKDDVAIYKAETPIRWRKA